ncbi:hypothetical protein QYF61_000655 [Mycteria americana]|uniref:Uncharacterized protein n=1 Tax=Mycteria americana TaxID=33587 RepID=A0AAN7RV90_MYCAM|nr:hypothetical protein QYF61_000655 [Mycteria americana]
MASSCTKGGFDWILGEISSPKGLSSTGTGCPVKCLSRHPWRYLEDMRGQEKSIALENVTKGMQYCGPKLVMDGLAGVPQTGRGAAVCAEGRAGRALKLCQLNQGATVSTWQKAVASLSSSHTTTDTASQTELWWEHAASQVSGCRVCPALMPVPDGSSEHTRGRYAQAEELRHLVTELWEGASRLRSIMECERESGYWNCTLPSPRQAQHANRTHDMEDTLSSLCLAEHSDLRDSGQWRRVPGRRSRCVSYVTTPLSQVPLHNRYEALQVEPNDDEDDGSSSLEVSLRLSWPMLCVKAASIKKKDGSLS